MAKVLIIEDEPLIAMMIADWLEDMGHESVGPALSEQAALRAVADDTFDVALLDVHLVGKRSDQVAAALVEKGRPFILASGSNEAVDLLAFAGRPIVLKPYDFDDFSRHVADLVALASGPEAATP